MELFKRQLIAAGVIAGLLSGPGPVAAQHAEVPPSQGQASVQAETFPVNPKRQMWFRHLMSLPPDIKTAGLHIEVVDAPSMTERLTGLFRQAGYNMVSSDQAVHRYELQGSFESDGKIKTQFPLGVPLENAATGVRATASSAKRTGDVLAAGVMADQVLKAGLTTPLWASGDLLRAVMEATGLRDSVNTALTGDRRGLCLGNCPYWEWSDQRVGISWRDPRMKGINGLSSVDVGVYAKGVFVDELTTLAINEFLRHHGVIQASEPPTDSLMPHAQWPLVIKGRVKATIRMLEK